jgi:two-component system CheB/CheR fusion protein
VGIEILPPATSRRVKVQPPVEEDAFVSLPSHELRTSIASLVGLAQLIDSGDVSRDQRQMYTSKLVREGRRLTDLVTSALELRSLETGHRRLDRAPADLGMLIQRATLAAGRDEERPIAMQLAAGLPLVWVDPEAILEVLANLLTNARRFSPGGGAVTIAASAAGDMVEVSVTDQGMGIDAPALPRLFRKFYRAGSGTLRFRAGPGLGLAICHQIVLAHGGHIRASSMGADKGARFEFTLPIARLEAPKVDVLVVEDNAAFASLIGAEFAARGLSTMRAPDAESAVQILARIPARAIVLDVALPGIHGAEFLAGLPVSAGKRLPIVAVTVEDLPTDEISALEAAGAIAVLPMEAGAPQAAVTLIADALAYGPAAE